MARILVADDFRSQSPSDTQRSKSIVACAGRLGEVLGQKVDLSFVEDLETFFPSSKSFTKVARQLLMDREAAYDQVRASLPKGMNLLVNKGPVASTILKLAHRKAAYSNLVIGTRGLKGLKKVLLGSISEEILRNAKLPVVVVGPQAQEEKNCQLHGVLVLGTDLGSNSGTAEKQALFLAKKMKAKLVLVHAIADGYPPAIQAGLTYAAPLTEMQAIFNEIKASAATDMAKKVAALKKLGVEVEAVLDEKSLTASEAILKVVRARQSALVVVGSHGRNRVGTAFFGSTVRDLVLESPVPVQVLRSKKG